MKTGILIFLLLFLYSEPIIASETVTKFRCQNASVTVYNSNIRESPFFVITIANSNGMYFYPFPADKEFLEMRCEKSKSGKDFLFINHFCGGSGCYESNYALIDLATGDEVLKPPDQYNGNADKAESILEKKVLPFSCAEYLKTLSVPNDKGEYCFISPLELG